MSVGPLGIIGSIAGSPLAQTKGADIDKNKADAANQQRQTETNLQAESAAGIGRTEEDAETSDRDADGRRVWELGGSTPRPAEEPADESSAAPPLAKDPTGDCGNTLDLSG
jgi:hypothetical protein